MTRITTALLGITLLIMALGVLSTPTIYADDDEDGEFETDIGPLGGSNADGEAELTLKNGVIKVEAEIEGLVGGHVFSVWGIHPNINGGSCLCF